VPARSPLPRHRAWLTYGLCGYGLFVLFMGTNMPSPLYRVYQRNFEFSPLVVTLVFSVYVATLIPALLLFGPLSDAIGRRPVLVPALTVAAAGALLFAEARSVGWLFAARIVQGIAMGLGSGAFTAAMVDTQPRGDAGRAALAATGCVVGGAGAGPLVAGALAEYGPRPLQFVYWLEIAALVPAIYGATRLPDGGGGVRWRPRRPHVPAAIRRPFTIASISSWLAWAVTGLFLALVPSYALALADTTNLALAGGVVALLFGCSALAQLVLASGDVLRMQVRGLGLLTAGMAVLVAAGEARRLSLLLVATAVAGVGQGLAFLGAMRQVQAVAPAHQKADVMSSFYVITYVGTGLPVIGVGFLATRITLLSAVEIFAVTLGGLCAAAVVLLPRHTRPVLAVPAPA
jgi:MFS family permease